MADKTIKALMKHAILGTVPSEFTNSNVDINAAVRDELKKLAPSVNAYRKNKYDIFELLQEVLDEVLPNKIESVFGMFADVKQVEDGQKMTFTIKLGKTRAKRFITAVSPAGIYETFRLDKKEIELSAQAYGGAFTVDFERWLDGSESLAEGYEIIQGGIEDQVYIEVQNALLASWSQTRPAATKQTHAGFDQGHMDELIQHVKAFGAPVIVCSEQFAAAMSPVVYATSNTPSVSANDIEDVRTKGYIGVYKGTPIVVLPQSFTDETCTKFAINPAIAYVLPAGGEKVVKVGFEGNTIIDEYQNVDKSYEIYGYKKFGVAIVNTLNWGIYQNSSITNTGWTDLT